MDNKFGADIITLTDEENNEYEFEHIDTIELNSKMYLAFTEVNDSDDEGVSEIIILRLDKDENGEEVLSTVDDENELEAAYEAFMEEALDDSEEDE
ncbi:MAG: DUF1292 domain-containing protein [Oscillospiraceae bacterium]|nr:DUF1292 domain-containing protein [Oscillospiraceae bacterium]